MSAMEEVQAKVKDWFLQLPGSARVLLCICVFLLQRTTTTVWSEMSISWSVAAAREQLAMTSETLSKLQEQLTDEAEQSRAKELQALEKQVAEKQATVSNMSEFLLHKSAAYMQQCLQEIQELEDYIAGAAMPRACQQAGFDRVQAGLQAEAAELRHQLDVKSARLAHLSSKMANDTAELVQRQTTIQDVERQLRDVLAPEAAKQAEAASERQEVQKELDDMHKHIAELSADLDDASAAIAQADLTAQELAEVVLYANGSCPEHSQGDDSASPQDQLAKRSAEIAQLQEDCDRERWLAYGLTALVIFGCYCYEQQCG
eukprot:gb/GFBE01082855.1/.p1 GENE.gb/GFBE01082855.1/~~gb/GFBE01082855.1/.p1  ORF type:complete len:317 (+),score=83.57 gb/GFBE01082855.1/:1-951(+)